MLNKKVLAVIKRELREKLFSRTFIFMTLLFPLLMFGMMAVQILVISNEGKSNIVLISETPDLTNAFKAELQSEKKDDKLEFKFETLSREGLQNYLTQNKKELLSDSITGVVYVPETALKDKELEYYSKTPTNLSLNRRLQGPINKVLIDKYFSTRSLSSEDLDFARKGVDFSGFKVTKEEKVKKEEGYGNMILSYIFAFLLYISILTSGQLMLQSVIGEKANRIVEVILSSVKPSELMAGKILGAGITSLAQMAIWLSPIILVITTSIFVLPPEITFSITMVHISFLLANFGLGLILFLGLFAMVGSIFDNPQDAQAGMWPIMLLIIIPFLMALSMMQTPNSPIANVSALLPFFSIMIMPVKMTMVEVPAWQLILCLVINAATLFAIFPIAGKIYRVGILRTGKKPKWSEVIKWLKYKY